MIFLKQNFFSFSKVKVETVLLSLPNFAYNSLRPPYSRSKINGLRLTNLSPLSINEIKDKIDMHT